MIDAETQLKLQAYLDAELPPREAATVAEWLKHHEDARHLLEELTRARMLLTGNEPRRAVPETREFYWSRIRRRIESADAAETAVAERPRTSLWWIRLLAPAGGLAVLALFIALSLRTGNALPTRAKLDIGHDIEAPLEEVSTISFRSESAAMTVVWVDSHRE